MTVRIPQYCSVLTVPANNSTVIFLEGCDNSGISTVLTQTSNAAMVIDIVHLALIFKCNGCHLVKLMPYLLVAGVLPMVVLSRTLADLVAPLFVQSGLVQPGLVNVVLCGLG
jgi:hypothetical protein